ncbi:MAG: hypothetical protein ACFFCV_01755 [Promethearchaeota archaeon]
MNERNIYGNSNRKVKISLNGSAGTGLAFTSGNNRHIKNINRIKEIRQLNFIQII